MGIEDITQDELKAEVAAFILTQVEQRPGPDWFSAMELWEAAREAGSDITYDKFHDTLQKQTGKTMERVKVGQRAYYRKL